MEGLKIVLDVANGATYKVAPDAFTELGADVTVIHNDARTASTSTTTAARSTPRTCGRRCWRPGRPSAWPSTATATG